jgi:quercetin dioxygenase-like cupin family protein
MKKVRIVAVLLPAAVFVAMVAGIALATPASQVTSTPYGQGLLEPLDVHVKTGDWKLQLKTKELSDVVVSENRVAPGGHFGWHSHPGPSLVIVKSGTSTFYRADDPDCTPEVHPTGSAYVDPGGSVHIARNEGSVDLVVFVVRLVPHGTTQRIDQPDPGNCDF